MENLGWIEIVFCLLFGGGLSYAAIRYLKNGFIYFITGLMVLVLSIGWMNLLY